MPTWLNIILEIIKIAVPALIVFATAYYLLKQHLSSQYTLKAAELQKDRKAMTLPLQLQAYERLSLFCERINLPNLILRTRREGMTAAEFRVALLLGIQQEYEHNITQQVYVSEQLWNILKAARDDAVSTITLAMEMVDTKADAKELSNVLFNILEKRGATGLDTALSAIKKEASLLFQ